jgi:hypothetical protein
MDGPIRMNEGSPEDWQALLDQWTALGATCITMVTSRGPLTLQQHIDSMRRFRESVDLGES